MADRSGNILVIDDELGMREGCRRALRPEGYQVDVAVDGEEGLRKVRAGAYDLVLLDVMMPGVGGLDLLGPILEYDPDLVCIIITGYGTVELAVQAVKQGAYDFISKPFGAEDLLLAVNQGLERRTLRLDAQRLQSCQVQTRALERDKEELERLDQAKTTLMLTVAHELRAPVAAIQGYLRLILDGYVSPDKAKDMLGRAERRAGELIALTEDLLRLARVSEPPQASRQRVAVADVLHEVIGLFKVEAESKHIELTAHVESAPVILAQREHVRQIWTNLVSNALRYTPDGGSVSATLATANGRAVGSVRDTGIGIAADDIPLVFQEFYRTRAAKSAVKGGTGLGLTIVKRIVEAYGGMIGVRSEPGAGSTFTFELPEAPVEFYAEHAAGEA